MNSFTTTTWGYKQISNNEINFYHILLSRIPIGPLSQRIKDIESIQPQSDGSVTISFSDTSHLESIINEITSYFEKKATDCLHTLNYYYRVTPNRRQSLLEWAFAFEGCLALLLIHDKKIQSLVRPKWQFINSRVGGLYLEPFTLFLYADYPKIIHPITLQNYEARKMVEQKTSYYIRRMIGRIEDAQPGLEGLALLSLIETKTNLSAKEIQQTINDASFGIKNPTFSSFFSPQI